MFDSATNEQECSQCSSIRLRAALSLLRNFLNSSCSKSTSAHFWFPASAFAASGMNRSHVHADCKDTSTSFLNTRLMPAPRCRAQSPATQMISSSTHFWTGAFPDGSFSLNGHTAKDYMGMSGDRYTGLHPQILLPISACGAGALSSSAVEYQRQRIASERSRLEKDAHY